MHGNQPDGAPRPAPPTRVTLPETRALSMARGTSQSASPATRRHSAPRLGCRQLDAATRLLGSAGTTGPASRRVRRNLDRLATLDGRHRRAARQARLGRPSLSQRLSGPSATHSLAQPRCGHAARGAIGALWQVTGGKGGGVVILVIQRLTRRGSAISAPLRIPLCLVSASEPLAGSSRSPSKYTTRVAQPAQPRQCRRDDAGRGR